MSNSVHERAAFARQLYYARLGQPEKAFSTASSDSLQAWVMVVDTLEKLLTAPALIPGTDKAEPLPIVLNSDDSPKK